MAALQSTTQQSNSGKSESFRHLTVGYLPGSARSGTDLPYSVAEQLYGTTVRVQCYQ